MRIPRKISDLVREKQSFIDKQRDKLLKSVADLQAQLLNTILSELIPMLDVKGGVILETENNYRLISVLDSIYRDYGKLTKSKVLNQVNQTFESIRSKDYNFLEVTLGGNLPIKFATAVMNATKLTEARFGVHGGKFVRGGFFDSLLKEDNALSLKRLMAKMITSQVNTKAFIKYLQAYFKGKEGYENKFKWFAYDVYQQYDAAYNSKLAEELDLTNFIYMNGLIDDSRDFCACKDGKVWTKKEAEEWPTWRPIDAKPFDCKKEKTIEKKEECKKLNAGRNLFPVGWVIKQKNIYKIPSYLNYDGYDPLIDRGGFNCRHQLSYISDELAEILRKK